MKFSLLCLVLIQTNILTSSENKAKKVEFFSRKYVYLFSILCSVHFPIAFFFSLGQCYWSYCKLLSSSLMLRRSFFVDSWTPFNRFNSSGVIHRKRHSKPQFHLWRVRGDRCLQKVMKSQCIISYSKTRSGKLFYK